MAKLPRAVSVERVREGDREFEWVEYDVGGRTIKAERPAGDRYIDSTGGNEKPTVVGFAGHYFLVLADNEQDAFDGAADYAQPIYPGLFFDLKEIAEDQGLDWEAVREDEDVEIETDDYAPVGGYGFYARGDELEYIRVEAPPPPHDPVDLGDEKWLLRWVEMIDTAHEIHYADDPKAASWPSRVAKPCWDAYKLVREAHGADTIWQQKEMLDKALVLAESAQAAESEMLGEPLQETWSRRVVEEVESRLEAIDEVIGED